MQTMSLNLFGLLERHKHQLDDRGGQKIARDVLTGMTAPAESTPITDTDDLRTSLPQPFQVSSVQPPYGKKVSKAGHKQLDLGLSVTFRSTGTGNGHISGTSMTPPPMSDDKPESMPMAQGRPRAYAKKGTFGLLLGQKQSDPGLSVTFRSVATRDEVVKDTPEQSTTPAEIVLTINTDNLRTSLPPPSQLSPVRPRSYLKKTAGLSLNHKQSDPGLSVIFRSAATGNGHGRMTPPRTPPPFQAKQSQQSGHQKSLSILASPPRLDIGKGHGVFATASRHGPRPAPAPLVRPPRPPAVIITRASTDLVPSGSGSEEREDHLNESAQPWSHLSTVREHNSERKFVDGPSSSDLALKSGSASAPLSLPFLKAKSTEEITTRDKEAPIDGITSSASISDVPPLHSSLDIPVNSTSNVFRRARTELQFQGSPDTADWTCPFNVRTPDNATEKAPGTPLAPNTSASNSIEFANLCNGAGLLSSISGVEAAVGHFCLPNAVNSLLSDGDSSQSCLHVHVLPNSKSKESEQHASIVGVSNPSFLPVNHLSSTVNPPIHSCLLGSNMTIRSPGTPDSLVITNNATVTATMPSLNRRVPSRLSYSPSASKDGDGETLGLSGLPTGVVPLDSQAQGGDGDYPGGDDAPCWPAPGMLSTFEPSAAWMRRDQQEMPQDQTTYYQNQRSEDTSGNQSTISGSSIIPSLPSPYTIATDRNDGSCLVDFDSQKLDIDIGGGRGRQLGLGSDLGGGLGESYPEQKGELLSAATTPLPTSSSSMSSASTSVPTATALPVADPPLPTLPTPSAPTVITNPQSDVPQGLQDKEEGKTVEGGVGTVMLVEAISSGMAGASDVAEGLQNVPTKPKNRATAFYSNAIPGPSTRSPVQPSTQASMSTSRSRANTTIGYYHHQPAQDRTQARGLVDGPNSASARMSTAASSARSPKPTFKGPSSHDYQQRDQHSTSTFQPPQVPDSVNLHLQGQRFRQDQGQQSQKHGHQLPQRQSQSSQHAQPFHYHQQSVAIPSPVSLEKAPAHTGGASIRPLPRVPQISSFSSEASGSSGSLCSSGGRSNATAGDSSSPASTTGISMECSVSVSSSSAGGIAASTSKPASNPSSGQSGAPRILFQNPNSVSRRPRTSPALPSPNKPDLPSVESSSKSSNPAGLPTPDGQTPTSGVSHQGSRNDSPGFVGVVASPSSITGIERGTLPTPPASASGTSNTTSSLVQQPSSSSLTAPSLHSLLPPPIPPSVPSARIPNWTAPSPPPRPPSRQAREHQKRQDQKRRRDQARGVGKSGSDVEHNPPSSGHKSTTHSRNGSLSIGGPPTPSGGGPKAMPMPLALNSAILSSSVMNMSAGSSSSNVPSAIPGFNSITCRSPSSSRVGSRTIDSRNPGMSATPVGGRRERSADSYLESSTPTPKSGGGAAAGYRVFKQGAEEVMERAGRTMGPRAAVPKPGRGRSSSAADLLRVGGPSGSTEAYKSGVERGSLLDIKQQHSGHPAANVRSAPTTPKAGLTSPFAGLPPSLHMNPANPKRPRGDTVPSNVMPSAAGRRRPSVTLNTSFAALSNPQGSASKSQPTSPIARIPVMRPLPVPGSSSASTAHSVSPGAVNPGTVRAFRALPSPSPSATVPNSISILQTPTPSSTTPTPVRPLPPARSKTSENLSITTPTLPFGSSSPRPFGGSANASSSSPKLALSLSIPNLPHPGKSTTGTGSPRMLPTPLTTTKEKQKDLKEPKDLDLPSVLSNEPFLKRNKNANDGVGKTRAKQGERIPQSRGEGGKPGGMVTKKPAHRVAHLSTSEFSPISTSSSTSGAEGLNSHPAHFNAWETRSTLHEEGNVLVEIEDEIVFRARAEVDYEDGTSDVEEGFIISRVGTNQEYASTWAPGDEQVRSDSDRSKPISPIVVGNTTFNDSDEALAGDPRHRHKQWLLTEHKMQIGNVGVDVGLMTDEETDELEMAENVGGDEGYQFDYEGYIDAPGDDYELGQGVSYHLMSRSPSPIRYARPDSRGNPKSHSRSPSPDGVRGTSGYSPSRSISPMSVRSGRSYPSTSRSSSISSLGRGRRKSFSTDDLEILDDHGYRRVRRRKEQPRSYRHSYRAPVAMESEFDGPRRGRGGAMSGGGSYRGRGGSVSTTGSRDQINTPGTEEEKKQRPPGRRFRDAVSRAFDFDAEKETKEKERDKENGSILFRKLKGRGGGVPPSTSDTAATIRSTSSSTPSSVLDISTPEMPENQPPKIKGKKSKLGSGSRPGTAETQSGSSGKSFSALSMATGLWKSAPADKATLVPLFSTSVNPVSPTTPTTEDLAANAHFMWVSRTKPLVRPTHNSGLQQEPTSYPADLIATLEQREDMQGQKAANPSENSRSFPTSEDAHESRKANLSSSPILTPVAISTDDFQITSRTRKGSGFGVLEGISNVEREEESRKKAKKRTASVPAIPFQDVAVPREVWLGQTRDFGSRPFEQGTGLESSHGPPPSLHYDSEAVLSITTRRPKSRTLRNYPTDRVAGSGEAAGSDDEEAMDVSQVIPKLRDLKSKSSKASFRQLRGG